MPIFVHLQMIMTTPCFAHWTGGDEDLRKLPLRRDFVPADCGIAHADQRTRCDMHALDGVRMIRVDTPATFHG